MRPVRLLVAGLGLAVVAAAFAPFGTATAGTVTSPGTNIGNAGVLTGGNTGAGNLTQTSDDWWVFYLPTPGAAPDVAIDNGASSTCGVEASLYTTEGTAQQVARS